MEIRTLKLGNLKTNCYILKEDNEVLIIDPGSEYSRIVNEIGNNKLLGIIVTHYHFDHIGALDSLVDKYNVPIYDINNFKEDEIKLGNFKFNMIRTKGHTSDSITIYFKDEKIMFTGDFLFRETIGRTDFGGNDADMKESIKKIKEYSNITIYPGHGKTTTIDYEKANNPYLK